MDIKFDYYTFRARLIPTYLILLPLILLAFALFPDLQNILGVLGGILASFGLTFLLSQLGRDAGKRREHDLFRSWDGAPTDRILSHAKTSLDEVSLQRYHQKLEKLIPGLKMPTSSEEINNSEKALQVYRSCTKYLRENTRDTKKFTLIFSENVSYGFRRNLWGMRQVGVSTAYFGFTMSFVFFIYELTTSKVFLPLPLILGVICGLMLLFWIFVVNPKWVKIPAEGYAERLICALDIL